MKHMARLLTIIMIAGILCGYSAAAAEGTQVFVVVNNQKFYKTPSESADVVGTLGYGDCIICTNIENDWAFVESDGKTAYCPLKALSSKDPNVHSQEAYVKTADARFCKRPDDNAASKAIRQNTCVTIIAITPDEKWCRVENGEKTGYIKSAELDGKKTEISASLYVSENYIKVYKSASRSSDVIAYSGYGAKLNCVEINGDWVKVKNGSRYGWVRADGLAKKNPNTLSESVTANSKLTVREYPSTSASSVGTVASGTTLTATAATPDGKWLRVKNGDKRGYVQSSDVSNADSKKVEAVLKLAAQQMGKPYVYATRGPNSFDCAGLTIYCFAKYSDVELGRSAELQGYNEKLKKIESIDDLKKGDIVCFNTDAKDDDLSDHVGIYLGGGKFVHASSAKGKVVVSSMKSGYYKRVFSWGCRIID